MHGRGPRGDQVVWGRPKTWNVPAVGGSYVDSGDTPARESRPAGILDRCHPQSKRVPDSIGVLARRAPGPLSLRGGNACYTRRLRT